LERKGVQVQLAQQDRGLQEPRASLVLVVRLDTMDRTTLMSIKQQRW